MNRDFVSTLENSVLMVEVDLKIYSLKAVMKTAYWYTGLCYLHIQHAGPDSLEVRFKLKQADAERNLPEEFMNNLLDQTLRERVSAATEPLRNLIMAHALSKTCLIAPEFESAQITDDPNGFSTPDDAKHH